MCEWCRCLHRAFQHFAGKDETDQAKVCSLARAVQREDQSSIEGRQFKVDVSANRARFRPDCLQLCNDGD